jgi:monoamine oxidase
MDYDRYPWINRMDTFNPRVLFKRPRISDFDRPGTRKKVAVIGGGIAGLTAAFELRELGHEPMVFEASNRWGGRIRTARFADGSYGELGAMRIPEDHVGVLGYVDDFGLGTPREFVHLNGAGWLKFRDTERTRLRHFEDILPAYRNLQPRNWVLPTDIWQRLTIAALAQSSGSPSWWDLFCGNLSNPHLLQYEEVTLWQYLQGHTLRRRVPLLNKDEWEWVGRGTGLYWFEAASMLEHLVEVGALLAPLKYEIPGGMELLVEKFVERLQGHLRLASPVEELRLTDLGVAVTSRDQFGWHTEEFAYVIATVPAPALLRIRASTDVVPTSLREALSGVRYETAAKTVVHCRRRVWESDDGIAGGGSFTDLPIQQCWYPSDNARPMTVAEEESLDGTTRVAMLAQTDGGVQATQVPAAWTPIDSNASHGPGAFVAAYMWGSNAQRYAALNCGERDDLVIRGLEELHPGIESYIEDIEHLSWGDESGPGGGAFAFFRPGEYARYQEELCKPQPIDRPRVFFAGEHLAVLHAWIQSSMQTAWAAVVGVVQQ